MRSRASGITLTAIFALLMLGALDAAFSQTVIYERGSNEILGFLSANNQGQVAFTADSANCPGGVRRNAQPYACSTVGGWFSSERRPTIADSGTVYFAAGNLVFDGDDYNGVLKGAQPGPLVDDQWTGDTVDADDSAFYNEVAVNAAGTVAWVRRDNVEFRRPNQPAQEVVDRAIDVRLTDDGTIIVLGRDRDAIVAYAGQSAPFTGTEVFGVNDFRFPTDSARIDDFDANAGGTSVVLVGYDGASGEYYDVFRVTGGSVTLVTSTEGDPGVRFGAVRIADDGTIAIGALSFRDSAGFLVDATAILTTPDLTRPMIANGHVFGPDQIVGQLFAGNFDISNAGVFARVSLTPTGNGGFDDFIVQVSSPLDFPPPETNARFWSAPLGGSFGNASNWDPAMAPGTGDAAIFDLDAGPYTVTAAGESAGRAVVERGQVDLTGPLALISANANAPSLAVHNESGNVAFLNLRSGALLNTVWVTVGSPNFIQVTDGGQLVNENTVVVGGGESNATIATMNVLAGGKVATRELRLGDSAGDGGTMAIDGAGSEVRIEEKIALGRGAGTVGTLLVTNGGRVVGEAQTNGPVIEMAAGADTAAELRVDGPTSRMDAASIVLAQLGDADVDITNGGAVSLALGLSLCPQISASGSLDVVGESGGMESLLDVRDLGVLSYPTSGNCKMRVNGGRLQSTLVQLQAAPLSRVELIASNLGAVEIDDALSVLDNGSVELTSGAVMTSASGSVRGTSTHQALIWLRDGEWNVVGDVEVGNADAERPVTNPFAGSVLLFEGGRLDASRLLLRPDARALGVGAIDADVDADPGSQIAATVSTSSSASTRATKGLVSNPTALTIAGNLTSAGATIELHVAGETSDLWGKLLVTGDATLDASTTIRLWFTPGYAPMTGQTFTLIEAGGTLVYDPGEARLFFGGLEDGFLYDASLDAEGNLEFQALTDGVPYAADTLFRNGFSDEFRPASAAR